MNNLIQKFGLGEIISAVSGLVLLVLLSTPWFSWIITAITLSDSSGSRSPQGAMTIWQATPTVGYILVFSGVVAIGLAVFKRIRQTNLPAWASMLLIALGILSAGLMLKSVILPPTDVRLGGGIRVMDVPVTLTIGAWFGFVATFGIIYGGILIRRRENSIVETP